MHSFLSAPGFAVETSPTMTDCDLEPEAGMNPYLPSGALVGILSTEWKHSSAAQVAHCVNLFCSDWDYMKPDLDHVSAPQHSQCSSESLFLVSLLVISNQCHGLDVVCSHPNSCRSAMVSGVQAFAGELGHGGGGVPLRSQLMSFLRYSLGIGAVTRRVGQHKASSLTSHVMPPH